MAVLNKFKSFILYGAAFAALVMFDGSTIGQANAETALDNATSAMQKGDINAAEQYLTDAADAGNAVAMRNLAKLHYLQRVEKPNLELAKDLLLKAAGLGLSEANIDLGVLYERGIGRPVDKVLATTFYKKASDAGDVEGQYFYGKAIISTGAASDQIQSGLEALNEASAAGYPPAVSAVGDLFRSGTFAPVDAQRALEYYEVAAQGGFVEAFNTIGDIYAFGETGVIDLEQARNWYERAAKLGQIDATYALAILMYNAPDASKTDLRLAYEYAKVASLAWHESAQYLLGKMYLEGRVVSKDDFEAYRWFDLAASAGVVEAHYLRAIAGDALGPARSKEANQLAAEWFSENHATPHIHRLLADGLHSFR